MGSGTSRAGLLLVFLVATGACTAFGALKGSASIGFAVGLPTGLLLSSLGASQKISIGPTWFAQSALGRSRWVDLPTLKEATVRRARNGQRTLTMRDAEGRRVRVDLAMAADPSVRQALHSTLPDHTAAGFDETFRALLRQGQHY